MQTNLRTNVVVNSNFSAVTTIANTKTTDQDKILHKKFVLYGSNVKEWMKKCILLLPEIEKNQIWKKKGFSSIYEYAAKLAGMNREKVNESLRILKKIEDKPALMAVVEAKGIGAVRPVATIATIETDGLWAEKAKVLTKNELEAYVRGLCAQCELCDGRNSNGNFDNLHRPSTAVESGKTGKSMNFDGFETSEKSLKIATIKTPILMDLEPEVLDQLKKLKGDNDWNTLMKEFLAIRKEKFEEEKPDAVETDSRYIPKKIENYVLQKFNYRCAFPGCTKKYDVLHHITRFGFAKEHDPDEIVPLCHTHHSLIHRGLVKGEIGLRGVSSLAMGIVDSVAPIGSANLAKTAQPEHWRMCVLGEESVQTELDELMCRRKTYG